MVANMVHLHQTMSTRVVTIKIEVKKGEGWDEEERYELYDGVVLSSQQNCLYIIASCKIRDRIDTNLIQVVSPNGALITLNRDDFDMRDQDSKIIGIRCIDPTPGHDFGFRKLHPIVISEDDARELQEVYTYSHHFKEKLLTPGSVMLVEDDTFDHDCLRYTHTHDGAPTVNMDGDFVGFCFLHRGYLTSYNLREVAAQIDRNQGREFTTIADTFGNLRQLCRVIAFSVRLNIQKAATGMTGRYYVRDVKRRKFFE